MISESALSFFERRKAILWPERKLEEAERRSINPHDNIKIVTAIIIIMIIMDNVNSVLKPNDVLLNSYVLTYLIFKVTWVMSPQNSYVEILPIKVLALGDVVFGTS